MLSFTYSVNSFFREKIDYLVFKKHNGKIKISSIFLTSNVLQDIRLRNVCLRLRV